MRELRQPGCDLEEHEMTDYSPREYYSFEAVEERCKEMDDKVAKYSDHEEIQFALWRCEKINAFLAKYEGRIQPEDVRLEMKGGAEYWHMNRNPMHVVKLVAPHKLHQNLVKRHVQKGEQCEFYWVITEEI